MDALDQYIAKLQEPAVRAYWHKIHGVEDDDPGSGGESVVGEADLAAKEAELGVALPPSYRQLVQTTRPEDGIWGVCWPHELAAFEDRIDLYPPFLVGVVCHGDGDYDCLDTRYPDDQGEYPIVRFDHERQTEASVDFEVVAKNLGDYLLGSLGGETPA